MRCMRAEMAGDRRRPSMRMAVRYGSFSNALTSMVLGSAGIEAEASSARRRLRISGLLNTWKKMSRTTEAVVSKPAAMMVLISL